MIFVPALPGPCCKAMSFTTPAESVLVIIVPSTQSTLVGLGGPKATTGNSLFPSSAYFGILSLEGSNCRFCKQNCVQSLILTVHILSSRNQIQKDSNPLFNFWDKKEVQILKEEALLCQSKLRSPNFIYSKCYSVKIKC